MPGLQNQKKNIHTDTDVINLKLYGLFVTSITKFRLVATARQWKVKPNQKLNATSALPVFVNRWFS